MAAVIILAAGCRIAGREDGTGPSSHQALDSLRGVYRRFNVNGQYDSLIATARPEIQKALASGDTLALLYSGVYTAQAFLIREDIDSLRHYMELMAPYRRGGDAEPSLQAVLYNVEGLMHLKSELNYSLALESFHEGCRWAELGDDPNNHIVLLANIAHIFFVRHDPNGLEYAREAYAIAGRPEVATFPRCQANLLMGQMLLLAEEPDNAGAYLDTAGRMIEAGDYRSLRAIYHLLRAKQHQKLQNFSEAESGYSQAMKWAGYAEASTASMIYVEYGEFCQERGRIGQALELYLKGLEASQQHRSLEFRGELLSHVADTYRIMGDRVSAAEYSYLYKAYMDDIAGLQKEQEFNRRLMQYSQMEHEHELQAKELALMKARRRASTLIFISAVIVILALSLCVLYLKQKKMNRTLVQQYEDHVRRTLPSGDEPLPGQKTAEDSAESQLFRRIEELMRKDKVYRQKDLSLDKMAEMLSTNRSYVSKAINSCASRTFFGYIDQYRIREAVSFLSPESESTEEMSFKHIADIVGYNSVQVFYRSFKKETGCSPGQYKEEVLKIKKQRCSAPEA